MKILIFTSIEGRQEITDLFLMGVKRLKIFPKDNPNSFELFCVCSTQNDSDYLTSKGVEHCIYPNKPLSAKMDYGFKQALKKDFDYMLRLGSDDLLDHEVFEKYYNDLMKDDLPYFGMGTIGVVNYETLEAIVYRYKYKGDRILGGGSMLSRSLCLKFEVNLLYNRKPLNRGLDNASDLEIRKHVKQTLVTTDKPMLIDIKSKKNIHGFGVVAKGMKKTDINELTHFLSVEEDTMLKTKGANLTVAAIIPVKGRLPLLKHTITRLKQKNGVNHVICVGSEDEREVCEQAGAIFIIHENYPLGKKWNAGFMKAKELKPDVCLFVGSSDWISDNWIEYCSKYMSSYDMVGKPDFKLLDYGKQFRMCDWKGYTDPRRKGEPIGIGRMISSRILDLMNWQPMNPNLDSSLDYSMWQKVLQVGGRVKLLETDEIHSLSLSTD
jgi:hypothetical protein